MKYLQPCNILSKRKARIKENNCSLSGIKIENTGFDYTLSVIGGKYKMIILYWLNENTPTMHFNELKRCIGTISFKTLHIKRVRERQTDCSKRVPLNSRES